MVGKRLKELRLEKKWSLRRLERETEHLGHKVSNAYISQLENDDKYEINPSLATLDVLARALGTTASALLREADGVTEEMPRRTSSPVIARAQELMTSSGLGTNLSAVTKVSEGDIERLDGEDPDLTIVQKMAYHLNTSMHFLLGRTDDPSPLPGVAAAHHNPDKGVEPGEPLPPETQLIVERAIMDARKEWGWGQ